MARDRLLVAVLLVALVAAAFWAANLPDETPDAQPSTTASVQDSPGPAGVTRRTSKPRAPRAVQAATEEPIANDPARAPAPAAERAAPVAVIHVTDVVTGRILPTDATPPRIDVWAVVIDTDDPSGVRIVGPLAAEFDPTPETIPPKGEPVRRVVVRPPSGALAWWIRKDDRWWRGEAGATRDRPNLQLTRAAGLVRLLDASGRAVPEVDVTIQRAEGGIRSEAARARTDAFGVAFLPLDGGSRRGEPPRGGPALVRAELPIVPPAVASFPEDGPWPVVLRLPAVGAIDVRVANDGGADGPGVVSLQPTTPASQETGFVPGLTAVVTDGVARFRHVGVGLRFDVVLHAGPTRVTTRTECDGPSAPGLRRTIHLARGGPRPMVSGRILRAEGGPAGGVGVMLAFSVDSPGSPWNARTLAPGTTAPEPTEAERKDATKIDQAGRFAVRPDLEAESLDGVTLTVSAGGTDVATRRLSAPGPDGAVDLGDMQMGRTPDGGVTPLLVAGVVRRPDGTPVPDASVRVWNIRGGKATADREFRATTDADGAFRIVALPRVADAWELRLEADARGPIATPVPFVPFVPGASDVVLVAEDTGVVLVRVLLPAGIEPGGAPWVVARRDSAGSPSPGPDVYGLNYANGICDLSGLAPGSWRIVAHPPGRPDDVLKAIDVVVRAGETVDAGTLDLRQVVPVAVVRVVAPGGRPAADGAVWWRTSGVEIQLWTAVACGPDGTARIPMMTPVDLLARRTGSAFASADHVTTGVTLTPPAPGRPSMIVATIADGLAVPQPPFRIDLTVRLVDADDPGPVFARAIFDPRNAGRQATSLTGAVRQARFETSEPGRWAVCAMLYETPPGGGRPLPLDGDPTLQIDAPGTTRPITVRWTPEALAEAVRRLRDE